MMYLIPQIMRLYVRIASGHVRSVKAFSQAIMTEALLMVLSYGVKVAPTTLPTSVIYVSPCFQDTHMAQMIAITLSVKLATKMKPHTVRTATIHTSMVVMLTMKVRRILG
jgi:hypothetical protein